MSPNTTEVAGWGAFGALWGAGTSSLASLVAQADPGSTIGAMGQIGGTVAVASGIGTVVAMAITSFGNSIFKPWLETRANAKLLESQSAQIVTLTLDRDKYKAESQASGELSRALAMKMNVLTETNIKLAASMLVQMGRIRPLAAGAGVIADGPTPADGPTILLIEDNPSARTNMVALLELLAHCRVITAASFAEGLAALEALPSPEFMILDLMLPDGDGTDLLRVVKDRALPTRVIVVTGRSEETLAAVRALHPAAVLRKPIDIPNDVLPLITSGRLSPPGRGADPARVAPDAAP